MLIQNISFTKKILKNLLIIKKKIALKKAEMNIKKNIMTDDHINSSFLLSKTTGISKTTFHGNFTAQNLLKKNTKKKY